MPYNPSDNEKDKKLLVKTQDFICILPIICIIFVRRQPILVDSIILKNTRIMFESRTMRNAELMSDYRRVIRETLESGKEICHEEVIRRTLATSRPRYHLSHEWASRMMHKMIVKGEECPAKGIRRMMWEEFKKKVVDYIATHNSGIHDAVTAIIIGKRASGYFLSYKQASKIIYHEISKNRRNRSASA